MPHRAETAEWYPHMEELVHLTVYPSPTGLEGLPSPLSSGLLGSCCTDAKAACTAVNTLNTTRMSVWKAAQLDMKAM